MTPHYISPDFPLGERFGALTVSGPNFSSGRGGSRRTPVVCDCGTPMDIDRHHLRTGLITSCGCVRKKGQKQSLKLKARFLEKNGWEPSDGKNYMSLRIYSSILGTAKRRGIPVELSHREMWDLFRSQGGCCTYTGRLLTFGSSRDRHSGTASVDRIDSSIGYVKGNVHWVHKDVNRMKNVFDHVAFVTTCEEIADHARRAQ